MDTDPQTWQWIWLVIGVVLIAGEMAVPGTFILIPFGISAVLAMILAFVGVGIVAQWAVFVLVGAGLFMMFWKMSRRSMEDMEAPKGAGADRLLGAVGVVEEPIPESPGVPGSVRFGGETWRAVTDGAPIDEGVDVEVVEVRGTRVVVRPRSHQDATPTTDRTDP